MNVNWVGAAECSHLDHMVAHLDHMVAHLDHMVAHLDHMVAQSMIHSLWLNGNSSDCQAFQICLT